MSVKKKHLRDGSTSISFVDKKGNDIDIAIFGDEIRFWKDKVLKGTLLYTQESINDSDIIVTLTQIVSNLVDDKYGPDILQIENEITSLSNRIESESYTRSINDIELYGLITAESQHRLNGDSALASLLDTLASAIDDETQARQNADEAAYAKAIESIAYDATAPTPIIPIGTTKTYKFSTGGAVSWLSSQIMEVGDEADVTRTGESTYTRMSRNVLSRKVDDTQIYNGLDKTEEGFALDVMQGKELQEQINTLGTAMGDISSALDEILIIGGSI